MSANNQVPQIEANVKSLKALQSNFNKLRTNFLNSLPQMLGFKTKNELIEAIENTKKVKKPAPKAIKPKAAASKPKKPAPVAKKKSNGEMIREAAKIKGIDKLDTQHPQRVAFVKSWQKKLELPTAMPIVSSLAWFKIHKQKAQTCCA
jgi:hypothetical protein